MQCGDLDHDSVLNSWPLSPSFLLLSVILARVDRVPRRSEINALVFDYLTNAGYAEAAAKFSKEANIQPMQDDDGIRVRREIKDMVHQGNIEDAVAALNDLDPEVRIVVFPNRFFSIS
jgi:hypothetical protein